MALAVRNVYQPRYTYVPTDVGNHAFKVTPDAHKEYEYMIMASWSEGPRYNDKESFNAYAKKTYQEYNNPICVRYVRTEEKK